MNILSLFDGISCGQVALERAGIKIDNYFASEIDSAAISVTQKHFPLTKQIGDVTKINPNIEEFLDIRLVLGGSPCQGFSINGRMAGFNDPRSKLFFEFARIVEKTQPKYFLLENVNMREECLNVISDVLGVDPVFINSGDFCAQNRERVYWTNIEVAPIVSKNINLINIIDENNSDWLDPQYFTPIENHKSNVGLILRGHYKTKYSTDRVYDVLGKAPTILSNSGGYKGRLIYIDGKIRKYTMEEGEKLQTLPVGYTSVLKSDSARMGVIGNGWTVDVLAHIFRGIEE